MGLFVVVQVQKSLRRFHCDGQRSNLSLITLYIIHCNQDRERMLCVIFYATKRMQLNVR